MQIMSRFFNVLHRTLCVNNRTMLKRLSMTSISEVKQISTSQKCYASLDNFSKFERGNFSDIEPTMLNTFLKLRLFLKKSGKYEISKMKSNIQTFFDSQDIQSIKLMDWSSLSSTESLKKFKYLSINAQQEGENIMDKDYMGIISKLTSNCWEFSDRELYVLLRCLKMWPNIHKISSDNHVRKLLEQIDNELEKRSRHWITKETLMYCDTVCRVFNFYSKFVSTWLNKLTSDPSLLSSTDIVQIMYYLFIYPLPKSQIERLQSYIEDYFDQFLIEELGIICLGFFRSEVCITSDTLLCKIMQKVIDNINNIGDNELGSFFKEIRYSFMSKDNCLDTCEKLLETVIQRVPYMTHVVLTQLSHLVADSKIYNQNLMTAIVERFPETIEIARLKDIGRMIFLMSTFNYPPKEPLYNLIINELRSSQREKEIKSFPRELCVALRHLAIVNIYPLDLISNVMGRNYMNSAYGSNPYKVGIEYFILDQSMKIEVPDYNGPRLEEIVCSVLAKECAVEAKRSFGSKAKQKIVHILNNKFNCQHAACLERILPHFIQRDIILCLNEDNNVIPLMPLLKKLNSGIKSVPTELRSNKKWIAIIFATETLLIRRTNQFSGNLCAKIRQLKKVGYVPLVIPYVEWMSLDSDIKKWKYLQKNVLKWNNSQRKTKFMS